MPISPHTPAPRPKTSATDTSATQASSQRKSANHFEQLDRLRREYERSNTHLYMKTLRLKHDSASLSDVSDFVHAAKQLAQVCEHELSEHQPLAVLFWARNKLRAEREALCRSEAFRSHSRREIAVLEHALQGYCEQMGDGKVTALV